MEKLYRVKARYLEGIVIWFRMANGKGQIGRARYRWRDTFKGISEKNIA